MSSHTETFIIRLYKAFRALLVAVVITAIVLPGALYVILSSDWAHDRIRDIGQKELTQLFGTDVKIGKVSFSPFNRLYIHDATINDDNGQPALTVDEIDARFEFWDFLFRQKIIVDYATVSGLDLKVYRDSVGASTNIDGIIQRLSKDDTERDEKPFSLRLNDVVLDRCNASYDVLSQPETPGRFNPNHVHIRDLKLSAFVPVISNDSYRVRLRSLSFVEESGLTISDLTLRGWLTQDSIKVRDMKVRMPSSLLTFGDILTPIDSIKAISHIAELTPVQITLDPESHVYLPDLKALVPLLGYFDYDIGLSFDVTALRDSISIATLTVMDKHGIFAADASGDVAKFTDLDSLHVDNFNFDLRTDTTIIARILAHTNLNVSPKARVLLGQLGYSTIRGHADGTLSKGSANVDINSQLARANVSGRFYRHGAGKVYGVDATAVIDSMKLGVLTGNKDLNRLSANAKVNGTFTSRSFSGDADLHISALDYKGHRYNDIKAVASISQDQVKANLKVTDKYVAAVFLGQWQRDELQQSVHANLSVSRLQLDALNIAQFYPGYSISGSMRADAEGESIDKFKGLLSISNLALENSNGEGVRLNSFEVSADNVNSTGRIVIASDLLNGEIDGDYRLSTLVQDVKNVYEPLFPDLFIPEQKEEEEEGVVEDTPTSAYTSGNNFAFDFTVDKCVEMCDFFHLPVTIVNAVNINGYLHGTQRTFYLMLDTPWLSQGTNGYFEDPDIVVHIDGHQRIGDVFMETSTPTKKGLMEVSTRIKAVGGDLDTDIAWSLLREKPINGNISLTIDFSRDEDYQLVTQVNFNPGKINFGNEIWNIHKSQITYIDNTAYIDNFALITDNGLDEMAPLSALSGTEQMLMIPSDAQSITVNGVLGKDTDDHLTVDLRNIELINIFETLDIDNALISGQATGTIQGTALLSPKPIIECEKMTIQSIGYNYCTLGDAVAKLSFDDGGKIFRFAADVIQPDGYMSELHGHIVPETESLELNITAHHIKVGFMKPFMSAFTSDVKGYVSGEAKLYGTFKDIDMEGDVFADSLAIKIDFTNTWYHASDSIHIRPSIIKLNNIVLRDDYGAAALLNGWVGHKYFHNASFDFAVTDARNFLCYDVSEKASPIWYGRIFGDGSVNVKGHPGIVDIKARISTAPNSIFTFVLSDQEEADEYSFITFRDVTPKAPTDSILDVDTTPERILQALRNRDQQSEDSPTNYVMDLEVMINPSAQIVIVMDPVGGDRIRSEGSGNMRMIYTSVDNDMRLYGKYTLEKGSYNFTLQDIIRKDFFIKEGSTIDFSGDPYKAVLSINAYAPINANLSDLDKSFLEDKELNRTNVPVRALLMVRGDMLQPSISFDLEFPTLNQDTYRKVKSIVSTEDMMSKQIIYLLALNRFYTPEYMASTTKGNELFSVASSTLASQLSNMLGKLSDNWSIAPNLRSDRGDFSDIEVDVTLSSSLLNNRLLFNGNFGYRDKSLNTNQFVGDFDLEYLLTDAGDWRFKAYNRYNDQNYYLRTAQTTQGLGLVYRRDFDRTFRFLKHIRKDKTVDTTAVHPDTLIVPIATIKEAADTVSVTVE